MAFTADPSWVAIPRVKRQDKVATRPPPKPTLGPIFIGDCVTSWGGRPMLLLIWEEWERRKEEEKDQAGKVSENIFSP